MQIWFTQKVESIFEAAEIRKKKISEERKTLRDKLQVDYDQSDSDCYNSIHLSDNEEADKESKENSEQDDDEDDDY
jgi:MoxR-like ATPase